MVNTISPLNAVDTLTIYGIINLRGSHEFPTIGGLPLVNLEEPARVTRHMPDGVTAVVETIRAQVYRVLEVTGAPLLEAISSGGPELASVRTSMTRIMEVLDGYEATCPQVQSLTPKE